MNEQRLDTTPEASDMTAAPKSEEYGEGLATAAQAHRRTPDDSFFPEMTRKNCLCLLKKFPRRRLIPLLKQMPLLPPTTEANLLCRRQLRRKQRPRHRNLTKNRQKVRKTTNP